LKARAFQNDQNYGLWIFYIFNICCVGFFLEQFSFIILGVFEYVFSSHYPIMIFQHPQLLFKTIAIMLFRKRIFKSSIILFPLFSKHSICFIEVENYFRNTVTCDFQLNYYNINFSELFPSWLFINFRKYFLSS
jgi:hypothetical protein